MAPGDARPLEGLRVVVTRAPEQAGALIELLRQRGAEAHLLPAVAFEPPADWAPLDAALRNLASYDWLLLTSQNAVRFFAARGRELGIALSAERPQVAVVGPATERAARQAGFTIALTAAIHRGTALARELGGKALAGRRVLLPRSDRGSPDLPQALARLGARVDEVIAYRTVSPGPPEPGAAAMVREGRADVIVFASPSAVQYLTGELGSGVLAGVALAAIGPVTAAALQEVGLPVAITALKASDRELVEAIESWARARGEMKERSKR